MNEIRECHRERSPGYDVNRDDVTLYDVTLCRSFFVSKVWIGLCHRHVKFQYVSWFTRYSTTLIILRMTLVVTVPTENWLYGSIQLKTDYIVVYPPENWLPLYSSRSPIHLLNGSPISENWLYSSISPLNWLYSYLFPDSRLYGRMSIDNWLYSCLSPDNWLYSSLSPRQLLNRSIFTENWLYSCLSHAQLAIV